MADGMGSVTKPDNVDAGPNAKLGDDRVYGACVEIRTMGLGRGQRYLPVLGLRPFVFDVIEKGHLRRVQQFDDLELFAFTFAEMYLIGSSVDIV